MRIRRIILVILLLAVASLAVYWFLIRKPSTPAASALSGSGTVEATMVTVSPEMAGRVAEVFVNEGDQVKAGDTLFTLDSTLMESQLNQAQVNLNAAQAGLDVAHEAYTAAQAGVDIAQAQYNLAAVKGVHGL
jgi:HlyD family secretion protein